MTHVPDSPATGPGQVATDHDQGQPDPSLRLQGEVLPRRRGRISQRLLVLHRWIAIIGQLVAVLSVRFWLGYDLPLVPALLLVAASVLLNLIVMYRPKRPSRLGDRAAAGFLGFDILQLSALLYLTGGLQNPFALLMLAPVTVAATMLSRREVVGLVSLAIVCLSGLALWHLPLPSPAGADWEMPALYLAGFWCGTVLASIFISSYVYLIERESRRMSEALTATQMALIREQKVSALGALAAAAAHELGSPLSTIRLVAKELAHDLPPDSEFAEDMQLLLSETARCRDILTELSRRPEPSSANPFDRLALPVLVQEIAGRYVPPSITFAVEIDAPAHIAVPHAYFGPEIQHGLGNIIQNASQFAGRKVTARLVWDEQQVGVIIEDDGPGFSATVLDRLGEPYVSGRVQRGENLGLGVFIAQTLLENLGADLTFGNQPAGGARVEVRWSRAVFERDQPI